MTLSKYVAKVLNKNLSMFPYPISRCVLHQNTLPHDQLCLCAHMAHQSIADDDNDDEEYELNNMFSLEY